MSDRPDLKARNKRLSVILGFVVCGMVGLSFASVPLYDLFCRVTGYGGTTQKVAAASDAVLERVIKIRFDASTNSALPWNFKPEQLEISLHVGETGLAFYKAKNNGDRPYVGTASFNVTPQKAGQYFNKIECFCFTEQRLNPGQEVDMPVTFFVDPEIAQNPNLDDVSTITLSYTFYETEDDEADKEVSEKLASLINP